MRPTPRFVPLFAYADAIHVATAIRNKVSVLYTYDASKNRRKGLLKHNLKVDAPPLRIEKPPDPLKGTLFDEERLAKEAVGKEHPANGGDHEKAASETGKEKESGTAIASPTDGGKGAEESAR